MALGVAFFLVPIVVGAYTDWQWFRDLEYQGVFFSVIVTRVILFLIFGMVAGVIVWLAAFAAYRNGPTSLESLGSASPLAANRPAIRQTVRPMLVWLPILAGVVDRKSVV